MQKNTASAVTRAAFCAILPCLEATLTSALLVLLLARPALAACPEPAAALEEARQAVLALEEERSRAAITQVEAAYACGPWVSPEDLGRLWLVVGARAALTNRPGESLDAFAAAARVAPGLWDEDLGPQLRAVYDQASARSAQPPGEVHVNPEPTGLQVALDGQRVSAKHLAPGGLHLLQIGPEEGPAVFARLFWLPADELLVIDTGLDPNLGQRLAAEAAAAKAASKQDPKLEAEIKELRRQAARDWGEIEADTRFPDARAERLLESYVARYGDLTVGKGAARTPVEIVQVREAQGRLDALPEARARLAEANASEKELQRDLGSARGLVRDADDQDAGLLHRVDLRLGGATTRGGSGGQGDGFGGLGLRAGLGAELRLFGTFGLQAELGYQGVTSAPASEAAVYGVEPSGTSLALGYGALSATWARKGLHLSLGPVYALGGGQVDAASAYADPEAMGLPPVAPVTTTVRAGGVLAGVAWDAIYAGNLRLSPAFSAGLLTDTDRAWPMAELGLRVGYRP